MSATQRITLNYRPRAYQRNFHDHGKRFNVLVWHRRAGKTVAIIMELIRDLISCPLPRPQVAYIAPMYRQAKRVAWDYVKEFTMPIPGMRYLESELVALFPNGGRFMLFGADNPDSLRGLYLDSVALDEVAQMSPKVWAEVLRPALADRSGRALFIGTPMGRQNQFFDLYRMASEGDDPTWWADMLTVEDTTVISDLELAAARKDMSEGQYRQEFMCDWSATIQGSFYGDLISEAERAGRIRDVPRDASLPVVTSWDLGLRDATVVVSWQIAPDGLRCLSARSYDNISLPDIIAHLRTAQPWSYSEHIGPHDLKVRELGSGISRLEIAQQHGMAFTIAPNWRVAEGIDAVRAMLPRVSFDREGCRELLEALRLYRAEYNDKTRQYRQIPLHDWTSDFADAVRMFAVVDGSRLGSGDLFRETSDDLAALQTRFNIAS